MTEEAVAGRVTPFWGELRRASSEGEVAILTAPPREPRAWHSYLTAGLSERELPELPGAITPRRVELVTYAGDEAPWPAWLLGELASYAADGRAPLAPYQAIALGQPLDGEESTLTGVLILPPYFEAESLAWLDEAAGVALLWAAPITGPELTLAIVAGGRALEDALCEADLTPDPDLFRVSVV